MKKLLQSYTMEFYSIQFLVIENLKLKREVSFFLQNGQKLKLHLILHQKLYCMINKCTAVAIPSMQLFLCLFSKLLELFIVLCINTYIETYKEEEDGDEIWNSNVLSTKCILIFQRYAPGYFTKMLLLFFYALFSSFFVSKC